MIKKARYITLAAISTILLMGCSAKHKTVSRVKESAIVTRSNDVKVQSDTDISTEVKIVRKGTKITYTPVSVDKPIVIEDETGKRTTVDNAVIQIEDKSEVVDSTTKVKKQTSLLDKSTEKVKQEVTKRDTKSMVFRTSIWVALGIGIVIAIVVVYRKSFLGKV